MANLAAQGCHSCWLLDDNYLSLVTERPLEALERGSYGTRVIIDLFCWKWCAPANSFPHSMTKPFLP